MTDGGSTANRVRVEHAVRRRPCGEALVLHGPRSSGRSTLLEHAAALADDALVVRAAGCTAEHDVAHALLHQLIVPFEDDLDRLPPPQASALAGVLRVARDRPDPTDVGCGLRTLLVRLAQRRPLLVLVDDVDRADPASIAALGFTARRLTGEPVTLLATARANHVPGALADLPRWRLRPLTRGEAVELVARETDGRCPPEVAAVLATASDGLPGELARVAALLPRTPRTDLVPPDVDADDALLVRTATAAWWAGDSAIAMRLIAHLSPRASRLGAVQRLQGLVELRCGSPAVASDLLRDAAAALPSRAALRTLVDAGEAALYAGDVERMAAVAARARSLAVASDVVPGPPLAFLEGVAATFAGRPAEGVPLLAAACRGGATAARPQQALHAGIAALTVGDAAAARTLLDRAARQAQIGAASSLASGALAFLAISEVLLGQYAEASAHARDGVTLARELEHPTTEAALLAALALAAAFRGAPAEARAQAAATLRLTTGRSVGLAGAAAEWALGLADLAGGDVDSAADRLQAIATGENGTGHPLIALWSAPHRAEAAVRAGRTADARAAVDAFLPFAVACDQPWAAALTLRIRALLAGDPDHADALFARTNALHARAGRPFEHARTLHLWGVRLRTDHQRAAATVRLQAALAMHVHLGDGAWAEQARGELRALGVATGLPPADEHPALTVREREIVRHVRAGATNREIAARLFLSPRTVDHHLRNVFRKLGIRSRTELVTPVAGPGAWPATAVEGTTRGGVVRSPVSP